MKATNTLGTAVLFLLTLTAASAPSPAGFAVMMAAKVRTAHPDARVDVQRDLELRVTWPSKPARSEMTLFLDRLYQLCAAGNPECEGQQARTVATVGEVAAKDAPLKLEELRVVVRSDETVEAYAQTLSKSGGVPVTRPLAPGLALALVSDSPNAMRWATAKELADGGMSADAAIERAMRNTSIELDGDRAVERSSEGGLTMLAGNAYQSSRMGDAVYWSALAKSGGRIVVAVPSAEQLITLRPATDEQVARLRALAAQLYRDAQRGVSPALFEWTSRGWATAR